MATCENCGHALFDGAQFCDVCGTRTSASHPDQESISAGGTCNLCGGLMRRGVLFAEQELTIVFSDNDEERFIEVSACSKCGNVQMLVDYDTNVEP
jgi:uncharacterized OB-fold protein